MVYDHNDRVKEAPDSQPKQSLPNVDRLELLQDHSKLTTGTQTAQLHDFTITDNSTNSNKNKDNLFVAQPEDALRRASSSGGGSGSGAAQSPESPTEIVKRTERDPKAPTVAFLDEFKAKREDLGDGTYVAHGEISRAAAEANGFNTVALQSSNRRDKNDDIDYSKQFNDIGKKIDAGELKLGKGDVLNVSMGNFDPTFKEANEFLGFTGDKALTPENLAANKNAVLTRMQEISQDPNRSDADRTKAQRVVDTNKAIDDIKARGIEVVHAAGNDKADRFSWDFMNASTELSSVKPSGKPDDFSASHSLARPGDGVIPVHVRNEANLLDPTPIAKQKGNLEIGDTGAKFPRTGRDIFAADGRIFNREDFTTGGRLQTLKADAKPLDSSVLYPPADPTTTVGGLPQQLDLSVPILPSEKFGGAAPFPKKFDLVKSGDKFSEALQPGEFATHGVVKGTSFTNIGHLKSEYERLRNLKGMD